MAMLAESLAMGTDLDAVIGILDPDGLKIGTFYLYDSYSVELRNLRAAVEQDPDDSALQERLANEEDRLKKVISNKLRPFARGLLQTLRDLAELDISLALAVQMHAEGLVIPSSGAETTIVGMFHPGVRAILKTKGRTFQPVDFSFRRTLRSNAVSRPR